MNRGETAQIDSTMAEPDTSTSLVSIIVPALNEADNIPTLVEQISVALAGIPYEVLIVDDNSRDATPTVCANLAKTYPLILIVRPKPDGGLSGAVLEGMRRARGDVFVVMDADLQHPPARIPDLIAALKNGKEFAVGSRYVAGGTVGGSWGLFRWINSKVATILAMPFAGNTQDPMSGFFALTRKTFLRARRPTPLGYKIGLELMCKCRVSSVGEVPIHFAERTRGESKLSIKQQFKYLEHLSRLYDFCFPRASPIIKFLIATACSWLVGLVALHFLARMVGISTLTTDIAYLLAIATTAMFHVRYVRTQREFLVRRRPWLDFAISAVFEIIACTLVAWWATHRISYPHTLEVGGVAFGVATAVRYLLRKELMQDVRTPHLRSGGELIIPDSVDMTIASRGMDPVAAKPSTAA